MNGEVEVSLAWSELRLKAGFRVQVQGSAGRGDTRSTGESVRFRIEVVGMSCRRPSFVVVESPVRRFGSADSGRRDHAVPLDPVVHLDERSARPSFRIHPNFLVLKPTESPAYACLPRCERVVSLPS